MGGAIFRNLGGSDHLTDWINEKDCCGSCFEDRRLEGNEGYKE